MGNAFGMALEGGTRWRRSVIVLVPALVVVAVIMVLFATGALAFNIAISGIPFKLSASSLSGNNFVQYAQPDKVTNATAASLLIPAPETGSATGTISSGDAAGSYVADTVTKMTDAKIENLYQTVCAPLPPPFNPLGSLLVAIRAGSHAGAPASAPTLTVNAPMLTADSATFTNITIGADTGYALGGSPNGNFSQVADSVAISNVNQIAVKTEAGSFTLPGLKLQASFVTSCP